MNLCPCEAKRGTSPYTQNRVLQGNIQTWYNMHKRENARLACLFGGYSLLIPRYFYYNSLGMSQVIATPVRKCLDNSKVRLLASKPMLLCRCTYVYTAPMLYIINAYSGSPPQFSTPLYVSEDRFPPQFCDQVKGSSSNLFSNFIFRECQDLVATSSMSY